MPRLARALAAMLAVASAHAAPQIKQPPFAPPAPATGAAHPEDLREARRSIDEAVQVVQRMKADPRVTQALERARGVLILPSYSRAALGIGVQAGRGLLLTRQADGEFSPPVFYRLTGVSIGAQAGLAGGELAFLLMTDGAVREFTQGEHDFSTGAGAALVLGDEARRQRRGRGAVQDVVVWSGTQGLFVGGAVTLNEFAVDHPANRAYYGTREQPDARAILRGDLEPPGHNVLGRVLGV